MVQQWTCGRCQDRITELEQQLAVERQYHEGWKILAQRYYARLKELGHGEEEEGGEG
jgi:hypothetical protein